MFLSFLEPGEDGNSNSDTQPSVTVVVLPFPVAGFLPGEEMEKGSGRMDQ